MAQLPGSYGAAASPAPVFILWALVRQGAYNSPGVWAVSATPRHSMTSGGKGPTASAPCSAGLCPSSRSLDIHCWKGVCPLHINWRGLPCPKYAEA